MNESDEILNDCWIDVLSFTKQDWREIETLAATLKMEGVLKGDDFRCTIAALALWVDAGKGIRESTQ